MKELETNSKLNGFLVGYALITLYAETKFFRITEIA